MFSKVPIDLGKISKGNINRDILRVSIAAELDATSLYEQFAEMTDDEGLKRVLLDVAKEEKTHIGEFQAMLIRLDKEQASEMENGQKEVRELTGEE